MLPAAGVTGWTPSDLGSLGIMPQPTPQPMPPKLAEIVAEFADAPRDVVLEMLLEFSDAVPPLQEKGFNIVASEVTTNA